jgi:4-amino-4-deoxy-L-arabinose transferase-like glycosyltransferase
MLAAALRFLLLGDFPPGLYHDEAFNGLDALGVLEGKHAVYFAANQGREPFFIYAVAATVGSLGRAPGALRLAAAICGTLTVPATYAMVRAWFNRRVALLSAAILATTLWHIQLSRVGFRVVTLPLAIALALSVGAWAFRSRRREAWLLTGVLYGGAFYTYLPARSTPAVLIAFAAYLLWARESDRLWPGTLAFGLGVLVALTPLGAYAVTHWDIVMGRLGRVSVFNPVINGGDLWGTVGRHLLATLGMFFFRGDTNPRHNLPGRPVFDPLMATAMIVGTVDALIRARRREAASALTVIWTGLMLVPTWLAEGAPHFLRAAGVLPPLVILPALGLESARSWLERRGWRVGSSVLIGGVLLISLATTSWDYFVRYRTHPDPAYAFEDAATRLAAEVNQFLGTGWAGDGIVASCCNPRVDRRVYLDRRLLDEWASTSFLIPPTESVTVFRADAPPTPKQSALIIAWPHGGLERHAQALPRNARITAHAGPLTKGDLEEVPYTAYVSYLVEPGAKFPTGYIARFGDEIALHDYTVERRGRTWEIDLEWTALIPPGDDYTVSVTLFDNGQLVAQDDAEPCDGAYPTGLWREGDVVVDRHLLELPEDDLSDIRLTVGMYGWPTLERLEVRDSDGSHLGTQVALSVEGLSPD